LLKNPRFVPGDSYQGIALEVAEKLASMPVFGWRSAQRCGKGFILIAPSGAEVALSNGKTFSAPSLAMPKVL
jgi:hypothetical protein